jgi:hypothetical protein
VHLACCTSFDILRNVVAHAWPPVVLRNILCHLGDSGVSCGDMVMKKGNHPPLKIVVSHNDKRGAFPPKVARPMFNAVGSSPGIQLYLIFLEALRMQNLSFDVGVEVVVLNTVNPNWGVGIRGEGVQVLPTSRVVERQGPNAGWFSQLGLQVDCRHVRGYKKVFGEGNDRFVVVRVGGIVWTPREGVSSVRGARLIDELYVVLLAFGDISCNTRANLVCMTMELEVRVIRDNEDGMSCTFKQVIPMFQSSDYSKEFPIIDRVMLFGGGECL